MIVEMKREKSRKISIKHELQMVMDVEGKNSSKRDRATSDNLEYHDLRAMASSLH